MIKKIIILISFIVCFKTSYNQYVINFYIPTCPWVGMNISDVKELQCKIYPNPAHDILNVESNLLKSEKLAEIYILDVFGKKIYSKKVLKGKDDICAIDVSKFSKSVYILRIRTENGFIDKKFVVY